MATGKHYCTGKTPARQPRRAADDTMMNYRPAPQPQNTAPRTAYAPPQAPARQAPARAPQTQKPARKKNIVAPLLAVLFLLAAMGIFAYILWDMGAVDMLLKLLA